MTDGLRRAIVEVRWGRFGGRKAVLEPGTTLRVGRSPMMDLALPHDPHMSAKHLALTWDGARCHVRDLGSAKGTWLGGEQVREGEVRNGGWIQAGTTHLMVYFEAWSEAGEDEVGALSSEKTVALRVLARAQADGPLFALVDASRGHRPLRLLREAVDEHRSLYDGLKGETLEKSAPYLVALRTDSGLLERLVREGWGQRWAIFLTCVRPLKEVRRHLRRFLLVEDDVTAERYYFRFYDPRTLGLSLPAFTPRQRADFFGEITAFFAEDERGQVRIFAREPS